MWKELGQMNRDDQLPDGLSKLYFRFGGRCQIGHRRTRQIQHNAAGRDRARLSGREWMASARLPATVCRSEKTTVIVTFQGA
jgi:hypothetical protein